MILSILICSLENRKNALATLLLSLMKQCTELVSSFYTDIQGCKISAYKFESIEIITAVDNQQITTGEKRNILLKMASGEHICYCDDDDKVSQDYISEILYALRLNSDCLGIRGYMTTDGGSRKRWWISKQLPYKAGILETGEEGYHRHTNHLSPVRRSIALLIGFPDKSIGEDYDYAVRLKESGLLKTETIIDKEIYHYDFKTNK